MSKYPQESNRIRDVEQLLNDPLLAQIPSDPQPAEIAEILAKNPSITAYIGNILADIDLHISQKKQLIKKRQRELELKKSNSKMNAINTYRQKLDKALENEVSLIQDLMQNGYTRVEAKEIARLKRPEKPRESDLSDKAVYVTRQYVINEIEPLEEELIQLQKKYDDWKVKYNLFDNNFKASQSIKGLIQRDRDKY